VNFYSTIGILILRSVAMVAAVLVVVNTTTTNNCSLLIESKLVILFLLAYANYANSNYQLDL
jgi:hypothetical protein